MRGRGDLFSGQWLQIEDEGSQEDLGLCQDFGLGLWVMDRTDILKLLKRPSAVYWLLLPGSGLGLAICAAGGTVGLPLPSLQKTSSPVPRKQLRRPRQWGACWLNDFGAARTVDRVSANRG